PASRQSPFVPGVQTPQPFSLVIFGATGDLAARKLLPALYGLWHGEFLPERFAIIGLGRRDKNDDVFRAEVRKAVTTFRPDAPPRADGWDGFLAHVSYQRADFTTAQGMQDLAQRLGRLEADRHLPGNRLFYLATDPEFFAPIVEGLAGAGL